MGSLHNITAPVVKATAAAPTLTEGDVAGLSQDLSGNLRVLATIGTVSASFDATATAAAPSYTEGTANPISQNLTGDQRVIAKIAPAQTLATVTAVTAITNALPAGTNTLGGVTPVASAAGGYSFLNIAAGQATTTVKSGAGTLHAIVFNTAAAATNTTTIYDNTAASGTVIGRPAATAVVAPVCVPYDLAFGTGLTIITGTANGSDMTVIYK